MELTTKNRMLVIDKIESTGEYIGYFKNESGPVVSGYSIEEVKEEFKIGLSIHAAFSNLLNMVEMTSDMNTDIGKTTDIIDSDSYEFNKIEC